jgi:hypothetical protein
MLCPVEDKDARGGGTLAAMELDTAGYGGGAIRWPRAWADVRAGRSMTRRRW